MRLASLALVLAQLAASAVAASPPGLSVSPVRVDLSAARRAEAIAVSNTGATPKTVEVEVLRWSQIDGEDRYEPATELRANPTRFTLAPGATQTARVGLARSALTPTEVEGAYRLYFREVPQAGEAGGGELKFALRIGVPVFVRPGKPAAAQLAWSARRDEQGLVLTAHNHGGLHARLADVRVRSIAGETSASGFHYVLPGARGQWRIPEFVDQALSVSALGESGRVEYSLD